MRCAMTRVLPEPGPARISSGPSVCSTASRWRPLSFSRIWETGVVTSKLYKCSDSDRRLRAGYPQSKTGAPGDRVMGAVLVDAVTDREETVNTARRKQEQGGRKATGAARRGSARTVEACLLYTSDAADDLLCV